MFVYFVFALCFHLVCTTATTTPTPNGTRTNFEHSVIRHNAHLQHHNRQLMSHRYNPNTHTKNHIDFYSGSESRTRNSHHNAHHNINYGNSNGIRNRNQNKTTMHRERQPSVNTKLLAITSKSSTKSVSNPLKLTLIQTNGHSFVANNYADAINTHFYRWPIAPQSPSTDYDIKWRTANNPFASNFNPAIETVPISTALPIATTTVTSHTTTTTMPLSSSSFASLSSTTMPTAKVYRTFTEHRLLHTKHQHSGLGRHVCVDYKSIQTPTTQEHRLPCKFGIGDGDCDNSRLTYDGFNSIAPRRTGHTIYSCCPGWTKVSKHSHGCTKPICKTACKNNGKCVKPEQCSCPVGYTGRHCEFDVNECETDKPCDQMCYNTVGSFFCTCRLGFILHSDRQSCKKIDSSFGNDDTGTAFEARDLENDVDNDDMAARINNIEKLVITEKERNLETNKLMHHTLAIVNNLKQRLDGLENRQLELNLIRERLKTFEMQANKLQYTVDLLYKCHHKPLIYCTQ